MKSSFAIAILCSLIALALAECENGSKSVGGGASKTFGQHQDGEKLLFEKKLEQPWTCCGWREYADVHFKSDDHVITFIEVVKPHGVGSAVYEICDGVGKKNVDIDIHSNPYFGIYYTIKVYGVPA